jgi:hypothetical protein
MRSKLLLIISLAVSVACSAQVSLNASMAPALNTRILYYDANVPSPPFTFSKSGTGNTWDFTAVTAVSGADDTTYIIPPASSPVGAGAFPTATHCTYDDGANPSYEMLKVSTTEATYLGFVADITSSGNYMPIVVTPPLAAFTFPFTYGSTATATGVAEFYATGAAIGQPSLDSVRFKNIITGVRDGVASGNMIVPSGSMAALLIREQNHSIDTVWGKGSITGGQWIVIPGTPSDQLDSSYKWYTNASLIQYATLLYKNGTIDDVAYYMKTEALKVNESQALSSKVYPNPVNTALNLEIPGSVKNVEFSVVNAQGQQVMKGSASAKSQLNVSHFQQGVYFLNMKDADGKTGTTRFVKE